MEYYFDSLYGPIYVFLPQSEEGDLCSGTRFYHAVSPIAAQELLRF